MYRSTEKRHLARGAGITDRWKRTPVVMLAVATLLSCGGFADEFLANTEHGRLGVYVAGAVHANPDNVTVSAFNEQLRFARPMLAQTLPPGIEVYIDVYVSEFGTYR
ncbi:MAG TPA: hypothetical protein PLX58_11200 [Smithellaceae bacterium]|nr:hypothetical protein [Smithellaceae bacterium]